LRFDKSEPISVAAQRFTLDLIVTALGGSKTAFNYSFMTADTEKMVIGHWGAEEIARTGAFLVREIKKGTRLIYRLSFAQAGQGTQGSFNLGGFTGAIAPLMKQCPIDLDKQHPRHRNLSHSQWERF
jgi:hypothetical protein